MPALITSPRTLNLFLRNLDASDVGERYVEALNDPEVVRYTGASGLVWDLQKVRAYVESSNIPGQSQLLGIFLIIDGKQGAGQHIGNIRLFNFNEQHQRVELGIMVFDKSQWGKGHGTEALLIASEYVFNDLGLHRIHADYYSVNTASARIFGKGGFQIEGIFKDHFAFGEEFVDSVRVAKISPVSRGDSPSEDAQLEGQQIGT